MAFTFFCLKRPSLPQNCNHIIIYLLLSPDLHCKFLEGRGSESCSFWIHSPWIQRLAQSWHSECLKAFHADRLCRSAFLSLSKFSLVSNLHSWAEVCAYLGLLFAKTENRHPPSPFCGFLPSSPTISRAHTLLKNYTVLALNNPGVPKISHLKRKKKE